MLTPIYTQPLPWCEISAYVSHTHLGDHTQDQSGLQQVGTYETWDFGITASVGENWLFSLRCTNVPHDQRSREVLTFRSYEEKFLAGSGVSRRISAATP